MPESHVLAIWQFVDLTPARCFPLNAKYTALINLITRIKSTMFIMAYREQTEVQKKLYFLG